MIISNATPLISFARIGELGLLHQVVGEPLVIPAAVAQELEDYERDLPGSIDLVRERWIQPIALADDQQVRLLLPTLDRGEAEVIALAIERKARLVVIDELIGRKVAESLGLAVTGSVGVLIRAKQLGAIAAVRPLLEQMIRRGIHFSPKFVAAVLHQVGE